MQAPSPHDDLAELMGTTTGASAVQEALQNRRELFLGMAHERATVPLASLAPPALGSHPWTKMAAALPPPPAEPMASCTPADFYFVRAVDLTAVFRLLDELDAWGSAAVTAMDRGEDREVAARYEAALGLRRGPLTRALGPSVVGQVAVVGSDPYLREGSDVTVAMQVKSRALLDAALAATLGDLEAAHGKLAARSTRDHGGVTVSVARSPDGAVAQERASAGDVELVSNSAAGIDAVLDAVAGKRPRLSDEPDFRYMLARDAGTRADVLAYLGDRFVADVVGPRQKVLEARRELAQGELLTPGFAALLYGAVQGKSPASAADLVASGLLRKDELTHADGAKIAWTPGSAARSAWGTVASMTPLADLPSPTTVTPSEKAGYERFASAYQESWRAYVDPVAIRVAVRPHGLDVDLRQLPLIDGTSYRDVADFVQRTRVAPGPLDGDALRFVVAIGPDSDLRRDFSRTLRGLSSHELKLDWIGDWAAGGVMDRASVAKAYLTIANDAPQAPAPPSRDSDDFEAFSALPLYAEISVKSAAQAALALAAVRVAANETIPGLFEWGQDGAHRGVPIVRVTLKDEVLHGGAPGQKVNVYYAVTEGALLLSLQRWLLEHLVDEQLDGTGPASPARDAGAGPDTAQLAVELATRPGKALASVVGWMLEAKLLESRSASRANAVALFDGAPGAHRRPGGDARPVARVLRGRAAHPRRRSLRVLEAGASRPGAGDRRRHRVAGGAGARVTRREAARVPRQRAVSRGVRRRGQGRRGQADAQLARARELRAEHALAAACLEIFRSSSTGARGAAARRASTGASAAGGPRAGIAPCSPRPRRPSAGRASSR